MDNQAQYVYHAADTRGHADHGWLDTYHSFSFASWHNPERMHFGALRVLNDDFVAGGGGFPTHPHDNMEIISIPLEGDLEHKDSMGNTAVIRQGDVQIMSAGTGIMHSEKNKNAGDHVRFLQIWVFPNARDLKPSYDQQAFDRSAERNNLLTVVSPDGADGVRSTKTRGSASALGTPATRNRMRCTERPRRLCLRPRRLCDHRRPNARVAATAWRLEYVQHRHRRVRRRPHPPDGGADALVISALIL